MFFGKWKYVLFKGGSKMSYICCHFFRTLSLSVKLQNWHFTLPDPLKYMKSLMTLKSKSYSTSKETKKSLQSSDHIGRGSAPPRSLSLPPALFGSSRTASLTRYFLQEATILRNLIQFVKGSCLSVCKTLARRKAPMVHSGAPRLTSSENEFYL